MSSSPLVVAAVSVFAFVAACGKPAACPTLSAVPVPERTSLQPTTVALDGCDGKTAHCGRAQQIRAAIDKVVHSSEFECLVTRFDQGHPIGQLGSEREIDECGQPDPAPGPTGLVGYRESRCNDVAQPGSSMPITRNSGSIPNEQIYSVFRASPADCEARSLYVMHLNVAIGNTGGIGHTDPEPLGKTTTSAYWFEHAKNYEVAGHWIHEHTHRLGFCDWGSTEYSPIIVSYVYGFAGCLVAARQEENNTKNLSDYRAACQSMLGPAFKP